MLHHIGLMSPALLSRLMPLTLGQADEGAGGGDGASADAAAGAAGGAGGGAVPDNPVPLFDSALRRNLDLLNHPEELQRIFTQLNMVWAVIFIIVGGLCVLNGYRWHKVVMVLLAGMGGVWAGTLLGQHVGSVTIAATCLALLFAVLAWPLLKYVVALFGGLAGAFAGANLWTAIGQPPDMHYVGALVGLIVVGMLAFMTFRVVVIVLTSVGGASLLVFGVMAAMMHVQSWRGGISDAITTNTLIVPMIVASAAALGAVFQLGGGFKGLAACAEKADTSKAKGKAKAA